MLKIIILISVLLTLGCTPKPLEVQPVKYPKIEKAKWQGNTPATLEDILRELEEYRAIAKSFS